MDPTQMLGTVQLPDETIRNLTEQAQTKAQSLAEAKRFLAEKFGNKNRVSVADVNRWLDWAIEDYNDASKPDYWRGDRPQRDRTEPKRGPKPASATPTGATPTSAPAPTATGNAGSAPAPAKAAKATAGAR
jgi:hypothetical protein